VKKKKDFNLPEEKLSKQHMYISTDIKLLFAIYWMGVIMPRNTPENQAGSQAIEPRYSEIGTSFPKRKKDHNKLRLEGSR
jgi:hypothetical protein